MATNCALLKPVPYRTLGPNNTISGNVGKDDKSIYAFGTNAQSALLGISFVNYNANRVFGFSAGKSTTGYNNCIVGANAHTSASGDSNNTVIGAQAMQNAMYCKNNTVIGYNSCASSRDGSYNVMIGSNTSFSSSCTGVVVVGTGVSVSSLQNAVILATDQKKNMLFSRGITGTSKGKDSWYTVPSTYQDISTLNGNLYPTFYTLNDVKIQSA